MYVQSVPRRAALSLQSATLIGEVLISIAKTKVQDKSTLRACKAADSKDKARYAVTIVNSYRGERRDMVNSLFYIWRLYKILF